MLVKVYGTARASVTRITSNWKNILEEKEDELMIILQNLREKQSDLKQINRKVIMLLGEEELENDALENGIYLFIYLFIYYLYFKLVQNS